MVNEFGMVLAGGGAKGAYQVGVFKALKEYPVTIKALSGTSIGGINAFAYAALEQERIEELWKQFRMDDFISPDDDWSDGISDRDSLVEILNQVVNEDVIKKAPDVYNTICEDETKAEYIKLNDKSKREIINVILATSALPVIYSKVNIDGKYYMDGGLADNIPIKPLYDDGIRDFIVISFSKNQRISPDKFPCNNLIEIYPEISLGELVDGTLNFSKNFISFAMKLGYADAKRKLNEYYSIDNGCHTAEFDLEQIRYEMKKEELNSEIERNMNGILKYL